MHLEHLQANYNALLQLRTTRLQFISNGCQAKKIRLLEKQTIPPPPEKGKERKEKRTSGFKQDAMKIWEVQRLGKRQICGGSSLQIKYSF